MPHKLTPDQIVAHVVANARLEGQTIDAVTLEVVRQIAHGELTDDEIADWKRECVRKIREQHEKPQSGD